jgi:hypothetical protein
VGQITEVDDSLRGLPRPGIKTPERAALEAGKTIFVTDRGKLASLYNGMFEKGWLVRRRAHTMDGVDGWVLWADRK